MAAFSVHAGIALPGGIASVPPTFIACTLLAIHELFNHKIIYNYNWYISFPS